MFFYTLEAHEDKPILFNKIITVWTFYQRVQWLYIQNHFDALVKILEYDIRMQL